MLAFWALLDLVVFFGVARLVQQLYYHLGLTSSSHLQSKLCTPYLVARGYRETSHKATKRATKRIILIQRSRTRICTKVRTSLYRFKSKPFDKRSVFVANVSVRGAPDSCPTSLDKYNQEDSLSKSSPGIFRIRVRFWLEGHHRWQSRTSRTIQWLLECAYPSGNSPISLSF